MVDLDPGMVFKVVVQQPNTPRAGQQPVMRLERDDPIAARSVSGN
jgi:hypothetical protein